MDTVSCPHLYTIVDGGIMGQYLDLAVVLGVPLRKVGEYEKVPGFSDRETFRWKMNIQFEDDDGDLSLEGIPFHEEWGDNIESGVLGFIVETDGEMYDSGGIVTIPAISEEWYNTAKKQIYTVLEPLGLWNEHTFGIHIVASIVD